MDNIFTTLPISSVAMSAQIDKFIVAFLRAQGQMGPIKKSMQAHRHKYANIDAVLEEVLPILKENEIALFQPPLSSENDCLQTLLMHSSGQYISFGSMKILHDPQDIQSYGGGITYTRRYALVSILGLPQEDDDGAYQKQQYEKRQEPKEMITEQQIDDLKHKIHEKGQTKEGIQEILRMIYADTKIVSLDRLTSKQYYFIVNKYLK